MHIEKVFQVGNKFYLVFPLCTGGGIIYIMPSECPFSCHLNNNIYMIFFVELYEHVIRRGHFSEDDAATLMRDLIGGLYALHQRNILHLDIKPENILFENMSDTARIKITDFGLSKVFAQVHTSTCAFQFYSSYFFLFFVLFCSVVLLFCCC